MQKALFTIDDEIIVEGIHEPTDRWNGWAKPLLTFSSVVKVTDWLQGIGANVADGGIPIIINGVPHWQALDEMTETEVEFSVIAPQVIDGVEYYNIGAGGWCWDEYTPPTCEACAMLEQDEDMTEEQAQTAKLCGDCEAYFGIGI